MKDKALNVRVVISREQDGDHERNEYTGNLKEINNKLHVRFSDMQENGVKVDHLLKVSDIGMEWIRSDRGLKSKTTFMAGEVLPFLFSTHHGDINMQLVTEEFSYIKKDTHKISVSYSLKQGDDIVSAYKTDIEIFNC